MSIIARLGVVLGINTSEFIAGLNVADQKSKEFKKNLKEARQTVDSLKTGMLATGAALVAFGGMAMKAADEISDLADANDTTVGKVLELKHALMASGGDASKLGQFYSTFTNAIDGAAQGNDKLRDTFAKVGISIRDLATLSGDALQQKAVDGLSKIGDAVTRNATAMDLFGKAAKGVDFTKLSDEARAAAGHYDDQAKAIKQAADAAQKLEMFFSDLKIAALSAMEPITNLINKLPTEDRINAMTKAFQILGTTLAIAFGIKAVGGVMALSNAIRVMAISNPWLLALTAGGATAAYFGADMLMGDGPEDQDYPEIGSGGGTSRAIGESSRDKMISKYQAEMKEVERLYNQKTISANAERLNQLSSIELDSRRYLLTKNQYDIEALRIEQHQKLNDISNKAFDATYDALKQLELASSEEMPYAQKLFDEKIKRIDQLMEYELKANNEVFAARERGMMAEYERQLSWSAGWDQAFKEYQEAAGRASDRGRAAFDMVMANMESALRNFVDTGKLNFKDFVGSVIKDLMYMELRAQASSLFKSMFGALGGMLGSLFSGGVTGVNLSAGGGGIPMNMAASGGDIGGPTIVGENGPELFIPRTQGTVVPNGSWQQMSGGSGTVINGPYIANLSAIDTQSGVQFLASNKQTIWAAYQSANRSVPISR